MWLCTLSELIILNLKKKKVKQETSVGVRVSHRLSRIPLMMPLGNTYFNKGRDIKKTNAN